MNGTTAAPDVKYIDEQDFQQKVQKTPRMGESEMHLRRVVSRLAMDGNTSNNMIKTVS